MTQDFHALGNSLPVLDRICEYDGILKVRLSWVGLTSLEDLIRGSIREMCSWWPGR